MKHYNIDEEMIRKSKIIPYSYLKSLSADKFKILSLEGLVIYNKYFPKTTVYNNSYSYASLYNRARELSIRDDEHNSKEKIVIRVFATFGASKNLIEHLLSYGISYQKVVMALTEASNIISPFINDKKLDNLEEIADVFYKIYGYKPSIGMIINKLRELIVCEREIYVTEQAKYKKIDTHFDKEEISLQKEKRVMDIRLTRKYLEAMKKKNSI